MNTQSIYKYLTPLFYVASVALFMNDFALNIGVFGDNQAQGGAGNINSVRFFIPFILLVLMGCTWLFNKDKSFRLDKFSKILISFFLIYLISISYASWAPEQNSFIKGHWYTAFITTGQRLQAILLIFLPSVFIKTTDQFRKYIKILILSLFGLYLFFIVNEYLCYYTSSNFFISIYDFFHSRTYYYSSFKSGPIQFPRCSFLSPEPSFAACQLYTVWPLGLAFYFDRGQFLSVRIKAVIALLLFLFTMLTLSTTVFIILIIQVACLMLIFPKLSVEFKILKGYFKVFAVFITLFSLSAGKTIISENYSKISDLSAENLNDPNDSAMVRSFAVGFCVNLVYENALEHTPFVGIGAGMLKHHMLGNLDKVLVKHNLGDHLALALRISLLEKQMSPGASSWPLLILVETGLPGLVVLLSLVFLTVRGGIRARQYYHSEELSKYAIALVISLMAILSSQGGLEYYFLILGTQIALLRIIRSNVKNSQSKAINSSSIY